MKRSIFKILGILLALCMTLSLLPAAAAAGQTYGIAVRPCEHGTLMADRTQAAEGETVTVAAAAESNRYIVDRMWFCPEGAPEERVYFNTTFAMPAENVVICGEFTDEIPLITVLFKVNVAAAEHGTVTVNQTDFTPNSNVVVTATPEPGYRVAAMFYTTRFDGDTMFFFVDTFKMPYKDVNVTVIFEEDPQAPHAVNVIQSENGTTSVNKTQAAAGETVTVKAIPDDGYEVEEMAYTRGDNSDVITYFDGSFEMPDCDVFVRVTYAAKPPAVEPLNVIMTPCEHGKASADKEQALPGETVTITALPDEGYVVDRMYYTRDDNTDVMTLFNTTFRMPECSVWVKVDFVSETPVIPVLYKINPLPAENGTFEADKAEAVPGETVTVTATPAEGYRVAGMSYVTAGDEGTVVVFDGTFTMPYADVYVKVTFEPVPGDDPAEPDDPGLDIGDGEIPLTSGYFTDVPEDAFYYEAVRWAVENEITLGTGDGKFSPDDDCFREQVVTFIWRALGKPAPGIVESPFTDVAEGAYYYEAVLWAYQNGITLGVSDTLFGVGQPCTREQVVTFLWRTAGQPEAAGTEAFSDGAEGQYYAGAVQWAAENEITLGVGGDLFGTGLNCKRGQIVTFLFRAM